MGNTSGSEEYDSLNLIRDYYSSRDIVAMHEGLVIECRECISKFLGTGHTIIKHIMGNGAVVKCTQPDLTQEDFLKLGEILQDFIKIGNLLLSNSTNLNIVREEILNNNFSMIPDKYLRKFQAEVADDLERLRKLEMQYKRDCSNNPELPIPDELKYARAYFDGAFVNIYVRELNGNLLLERIPDILHYCSIVLEYSLGFSEIKQACNSRKELNESGQEIVDFIKLFELLLNAPIEDLVVSNVVDDVIANVIIKLLDLRDSVLKKQKLVRLEN